MRLDDLEGGVRPGGNQWGDEIGRSELVVGGDEHEARLVAGAVDRDDAERWRDPTRARIP